MGESRWEDGMDIIGVWILFVFFEADIVAHIESSDTKIVKIKFFQDLC